MKTAFAAHRTNLWVRQRVAQGALDLAVQLGKQSPETAAGLFEVVAQPFCMTANDLTRLAAMEELSRSLPPEAQVRAVDAWGRWPHWTRVFLEFRRDAYAAAHDPRLGTAQAELDDFVKQDGISFAETMTRTRR